MAVARLLLVCLLQLLEGNFALFLTHALGHRNDYQNILLVIMVSVFMPPKDSNLYEISALCSGLAVLAA